MSSAGGGGSCPTLYVTPSIAKQAQQLIKTQIGSSIREGLELLLKQDLSLHSLTSSPSVASGAGTASGAGGANFSPFLPPVGSINVGELLQQGLCSLANSPHDALDLVLNAQTIDVRKAYKKMALKYHPDKNPLTTPIFQAIQGAHEKLTDRVRRKEEEEKAKKAAAKSQPPSGPGPPPPEPGGGGGGGVPTRGPTGATGAYSYQPKQPSQPQPQAPQQPNRSQSTPRATPTPAPPAPAPGRGRGVSESDFETKFEDRDGGGGAGGYGYQGDYRFQEAQKKAREREEARRRQPPPPPPPASGAATSGGGQSHQEGRSREYREAAARAAERRQHKGGGPTRPHHPSSHHHSSSGLHKNTLKKTMRSKAPSPLSSSSSQPTHARANPPPVLTALPSPTGLSSDLIDETTVELSWNPLPEKFTLLATSSALIVKIQLSWRLWSGYNLDSSPAAGSGTSSTRGEEDDTRSHTLWETAGGGVLIGGEKVRKKNLISKKKYEFRVRFVAQRAGGGAGAGVGGTRAQARGRGGESEGSVMIKGPWCSPIKVHLGERKKPPQPSQSSQPSQQKKQTPFPSSSERRGSFAEEVSEEEGVGGAGVAHDSTPAEEILSEEEEEDDLPLPSKHSHSHQQKQSQQFPAWYQLTPPPDSITRRSLSGEPVRYIVSLHKYTRLSSSEIVGYLSNAREVLVKKISPPRAAGGAGGDVGGNWILAQAHWKNNTVGGGTGGDRGGAVWGYCQQSVWSEMLGREHQLFHPLTHSHTPQSQSHHKGQSPQQQQPKKRPKKFPLNPLNHNHPSSGGGGAARPGDDVDESEGYDSFYYQPDSKRGVDIWVQRYDEQTRHYYYYNASTGQSEWEPPEWVEEKDPASGAR
jgi:curved DNA-binding protein CbpA